MIEVLEFLKRLPKKVPKEFFDSAAKVTGNPDIETVFSAKESNKMFVLLLRIQALPSPEDGVFIDTVSINNQDTVPFAFKVPNLQTFSARSIIIPPPFSKNYPEDQPYFSFTIHTSFQGEITLIHLQYKSPDKYIYIEYDGEEWARRSDKEDWETVKTDILDLLEKAITQAEQGLSE